MCLSFRGQARPRVTLFFVREAFIAAPDLFFVGVRVCVDDACLERARVDKQPHNTPGFFSTFFFASNMRVRAKHNRAAALRRVRF